ncbi:KAP family NTPase [Bifidobacterium pseudocatenulatum]|nr:KAP family NTPase [Bifidobacterium pseudocatenulatum]
MPRSPDQQSRRRPIPQRHSGKKTLGGITQKRRLTRPGHRVRRSLGLRKNLQREKDQRIIVFIDDIDRLADDEISALFRTVKSVGDLPNVIYVLLYDRHKVAAALARDQKDNGDKFLEKIIQVPIKVPEPSKFTIRAMVKNGLAKLKKCDNRSTPSGRRAHAILNNCITPLISSPREVHLLLNKTNFYYASIGDEVEFYDLAGITGIECFCPKLYS